MSATPDLFAAIARRESREQIGEGAFVFRALAFDEAAALADDAMRIAAVSPFRHLTTPGGYTMSVAMTNCGELGWVSDRRGYRYDRIDPLTARTWPAMPPRFLQLAARAAALAGFEAFAPDACLINRYEPGSRLSMHRDQDEEDRSAPIVSISLGLPAVFLWGGLARGDRARRIPLESGDVVVWGGPSRFVYHGIAPLADGFHPLTGASRLNLTFRRVRATRTASR